MSIIEPKILHRRAVINQITLLVLGAMAGVRPGSAQVGNLQPIPPAPDPRYPFPAAWDAEVKEVAPGAYAFIQAGGPGRDNASVSNAGFIVGDDGVLVIDTTVAPLHAKALLGAVRKVTKKPVRHVVITHAHADHFNGNQFFPGAEIIAHPSVRDQVLKQIQAGGPAFWPKTPGRAEGTEPRTLVAPDVTLEGNLTLYYGNTTVQLLQLGPAHTYVDTLVYLPQHGVIWLGDVAFFYVTPWLQNSNPDRWIDVCRTIEDMNVQTIIPGHGPLGGKAELADMRGWLELVRMESRKRYDAGMSAGAAAADMRLGRYDNWIGPARIVMAVQRYYQQFRGALTPDVDTEALTKATEEYNALKSVANRQ